jgi:hypothetical protein
MPLSPKAVPVVWLQTGQILTAERQSWRVDRGAAGHQSHDGATRHRFPGAGFSDQRDDSRSTVKDIHSIAVNPATTPFNTSIPPEGTVIASNPDCDKEFNSRRGRNPSR